MERKEACEVLGLPEACSDTDISDAYKRLAKACHPDAGGTDYLFRLISEAKDALKSNGVRNSHKGSGNQDYKPPKEEKRTWRDVVHDPSFFVPANQFLLIVAGQEQVVSFGRYKVTITNSNLYEEFIKTRLPVTVELRTWENWFKRLFGKPEIITKQLMVSNKYPFSKEFGLNLTISLFPEEKKYYKLTVKFLDQAFSEGGLARNACDKVVSKMNMRVWDLEFDIKTTYTRVDI